MQLGPGPCPRCGGKHTLENCGQSNRRGCVGRKTKHRAFMICPEKVKQGLWCAGKGCAYCWYYRECPEIGGMMRCWIFEEDKEKKEWAARFIKMGEKPLYPNLIYPDYGRLTEYPSNPLGPIREVWEKYKNRHYIDACFNREDMFPIEYEIWQAISQTMKILEGK